MLGLLRFPGDLGFGFGTGLLNGCPEDFAGGFVVPRGFAVVPLVLFTGSRKWMGEFVNARWLQVLAWTTAAVIAGLNAWLLIETAMGR